MRRPGWEREYGAVEYVRYLRETDYGRADGWFIELDDRIVGELYDPRCVDLFWYSYAVRSFAGGESVLADDALWNECRFAFRSRGTGRAVTGAFPGGSAPFVEGGRVLMRCLYLLPRSRFERLLLRVWSGKSGRGTVDGFCCNGARGQFVDRERVGSFLVAGLDPWDRTSHFFRGFTMAHRHDYAEVLASLRRAHAAFTEIGISNIKLLEYACVSFCASCGANLRRHYGIDGGALRDDAFVAALACHRDVR